MQRIEMLRDEYLPAFQRMSRSHDRPIRAACEIAYGGKQQRPGDRKDWPVKSSHLLQNEPPLGGTIFWRADDASAELFGKWHREASEAAKLFGDWVQPLGLDSRIVRPRWAGSWFLLFSKFANSESYPFPLAVNRSVKTAKSVTVGRDPRPLIFKPADDIEGKPEICAATSELIVVDDLLRATTHAIHSMIEAAETRKPLSWGAGKSQIRCDSCGFQRDCDPYCPPTRCVNCGSELAASSLDAPPISSGSHNAMPKKPTNQTKLESVVTQAERMRERFKALVNLDCDAQVISEHNAIYRRKPNDHRPQAEKVLAGKMKPGDSILGSDGFEYQPKRPANAIEAEHCPMLFDTDGCPIQNAAGENMFLDGGRRVTHCLILRGEGSEKLERNLNAAGRWVYDNRELLLSLFDFDRSIKVEAEFGIWIDLVALIAENDPASTSVQTEPMLVLSDHCSVAVKTWKGRNHIPVSVANTDEATAELIGDDPQDWYTVSDSLIDDSVEAFDWITTTLISKSTESADRKRSEGFSADRSSVTQSDDELAKRFTEETKAFSATQWSEKVEREYKARAKQGRGRKIESFYLEGVGGIYFGDKRTYVITGDEKSGYYSLSASHSEKIGKKIANEFSLHRR